MIKGEIDREILEEIKEGFEKAHPGYFLELNFLEKFDGEKFDENSKVFFYEEEGAIVSKNEKIYYRAMDRYKDIFYEEIYHWMIREKVIN